MQLKVEVDKKPRRIFIYLFIFQEVHDNRTVCYIKDYDVKYSFEIRESCYLRLYIRVSSAYFMKLSRAVRAFGSQQMID